MSKSRKYWIEINDLKDCLKNEIKRIMQEHKIVHIDFTDCGDCPIMLNGMEDETTYTLDDMRYEDGMLKFWASSTDNNISIDEESVNLESYVEVLECLENHPYLLEQEED